MVRPAEGDLQEEMVTAVDGAQGLKEDFLLSFANTAEQLRLQVIGLQDFINRTWEAQGVKP